MNLEELNQTIVQCKRCPRLVDYRENVDKRASFKSETYWRKPVPGYGDPNAWLLITGLAPSAHGANRTGRLFTGDPSADFLFAALHHAGLANQPTSESLDDGLILKGCYMTAAVKCVPPKNLPTAEEKKNCSLYYAQELSLLSNVKAVLALGALAHRAYLDFLKDRGVNHGFPKFRHGAAIKFDGFPTLYDSYHPSPQNTNTGKLTAEMMLKLLMDIRIENS